MQALRTTNNVALASWASSHPARTAPSDPMPKTLRNVNPKAIPRRDRGTSPVTSVF